MVSQGTFDLYFKGQNVFLFFSQCKSVRPLNLIHALKSNVRVRVYGHFTTTDNHHRPIFATTIFNTELLQRWRYNNEQLSVVN